MNLPGEHIFLSVLDQTRFFAFAEGGMQPLLMEKTGSDWFFYLSVAVVTLLAWGRNFSPHRFFALLNSFFSFRKTELLHSEGRILRNGTSFAVIIISVVSGGLFLFQIKELFNIELQALHPGPYLSVVYLSLALGGLWLLKSVLSLFAGELFKTRHASSLFLTNTLIINTVGGITLFIFTVFYFYTKNVFLLYIPLYLLVFIWIYRLIRSFMIGRKTGGFSILYIILYLCTLEILPIVVLYKLAKDHLF